MKLPDLPLDLASLVRPADVKLYLSTTGWAAVHTIPDRMIVYRRGDGLDAPEVVVPLAQDFLDYADRVAEAVWSIAVFEHRPARNLLTELLIPAADILRFRMETPKQVGSFLPFETAVELIGGCRKSLLAAACTVVQPQRHHPRLSRAEAETFLQACRLGTERGSFVATVQCPLATKSAIGPQLSFSAFGPVKDSFTRKVVKTVMQSAQKIVEAIEGGTVDSILQDDENKEGALIISSNICDGLAAMEPKHFPDGQVHIEAAWSRLLEPGEDAPTQVTLQSAHFPAIQALATALRPAPPAKKESVFIGRVDQLHGQPGEDALVGGDIVLTFQTEDADVVRARVFLPPNFYEIACDAHKLGHYVRVYGILERTGRIGRIQEPKGFQDISGEP